MDHNAIVEKVKQRNPHEPEFVQAAEEVILSVLPVLERNPEYVRLKLLRDQSINLNIQFLYRL